MKAPAIFLGIQPGFMHLPAIELFNLLVPVGEFPAGSTVSRQTLERHGYRVACLQPAGRRKPEARATAVVSRDEVIAAVA